jgi:glycosyltransferase involved in cell wall biosynthesis
MNLRSGLVSVLFPVHRESEFLLDALDSILQQSYTELEVLFLDNSEFGINSIKYSTDKRIRHLSLPSTFGLSETLNAGIANASGEFVARMDFDDISRIDRIEKQVKFLGENPDIAICGTFIEVFGSAIDDNISPGGIASRPVNPEEMKNYLINKNPLFHPTVMFRGDFLQKSGLRYDPRYDSAEDFDFWMRASRETKIANLPEPLLKYRLHGSQYSRIDTANSNFKALKVRYRHALWLITHDSKNRLVALKMMIKNFPRLASLAINKVRASKFKKFSL